MRNRVFVCFNSFDLLTDFINISDDIIFRDKESLRRYIESRTKNNYVILSENDVAHEIYVKKEIDNNKNVKANTKVNMLEQLKNAIINLGAIITSCSLAYSLTSEKLGYAMIPVLLILFFAFLPLLLRLFTFGFYGTFKVNDDK